MAKFIIRNDEAYLRAKLTLANILRGKVNPRVDIDRFTVQEAITGYEIITRKIKIPFGMEGYSKYVDLINRAKRLRNTAQAAFRKGFSEENFLTIEIYNNLINVLHTYHNSAPNNVRNLKEYPNLPLDDIKIPSSWGQQMEELKKKKLEAQKPKPLPREERPRPQRDKKKMDALLERAKRAIRDIKRKF